MFNSLDKNDPDLEEYNSHITDNDLKRFWCWREERWLFSKDEKLARLIENEVYEPPYYELVIDACEHGDVVIVDHKAKRSSSDVEYKTLKVCINCSGKTMEEILGDGLKHVMPGGV